MRRQEAGDGPQEDPAGDERQRGAHEQASLHRSGTPRDGEGAPTGSAPDALVARPTALHATGYSSPEEMLPGGMPWIPKTS